MWNAWIFVVALMAAAFVPMFMNSENADKRMDGEPTWSEQHLSEKMVTIVTHGVIMPFTLLYSFFLPIQSGTWWFFVGVILYLLGLVMVLMASIAFATAPLGEPMNRGAYAISRHPLYVGFFLAYTGIGIVCASWLFLVCAFVWMVSFGFTVDEEERIMVEKYGEAYEQYMNRTSRWIGFPKGKNLQSPKPLG